MALTDPTQPDFSSIRHNIQEQIAASKIPSLSIAVFRNGQVLWEESFGSADREHHASATIHTPYFLASVTKSFTATGILMLRDAGQLDLDRPVNEYLTAATLASPAWDVTQATVRRVLTHTAGLTTYARSCYDDETGCRLDEAETIRRYGIVFWPPGDHFDYSNLDYGILGDVVANVSRDSLGDFYRRRIFEPLGMRDCFLPAARTQHSQAAVGYSSVRGRSADFMVATPGASGAYCSIDDLVKFGAFALGRRASGKQPILSEASVKQMESTVISIDNSQGYGLGWWTNDDFYGYRGVLAQGGTDVGQAWLQLLPSEGVAVAVLSNTGSANVQPIINGVIASLLPPFAKRLACAANQQKAQLAANPPSYLFAGKWTGQVLTYKGNLPLTLDIDSGGTLTASLAGKSVGRLSAVRFRESRVIGEMQGDLDTSEDTGPYPYDLYVELYLYGNRLIGTATTTAKPDAKYSNELSYWVELTRTAETRAR